MLWVLKSKNEMIVADSYQELLLYAEVNQIRNFNIIKKVFKNV